MRFLLFTSLFLIRYLSLRVVGNHTEDNINIIGSLVRNWAPKIWLAPDERFFPTSVPEFLSHISAVSQQQYSDHLPTGLHSQSWYLKTKDKLDDLLRNTSSFLYGNNPKMNSVPIYAVINVCDAYKFHVTYWFFYPFSEGKRICTIKLGLLGTVPIPLVFNKCLGTLMNFGSHVGDWEHVSLDFDQLEMGPKQIYVSTHDSGVYYNYDSVKHRFVYERQETRQGQGQDILQKPQFPLFVYLDEQDRHPVLFSAKGSHGFWSAPGVHKFTRVPRLYDLNGFGTVWKTWENIEMIFLGNYTNTMPYWMHFLGKWGNPKNYCHPLRLFGINICQQFDGPTGIPMKRSNFHCN